MTGMFHAPKNWRFGTFNNKENKAIRFGHAEPDGKKRGTVILTSGYGGHIEQYWHTINEYLKRGFAVWAMDWSGHGGSDRHYQNDPLRPPTESFDKNIDDMDQFVKQIVQHDADTPMILSSHSMGAHIALQYFYKYECAGRKNPFDFAILAAPMLDFNTHILPRSVFKGIVNTMSKAGLKNFTLPGGTTLWGRAKQVGANLREASKGKVKLTIKGEEKQDLSLGNPTVEWLRKSYKSMKAINRREFLEKIKTPMLIGTGEFDNLVDNKAQIRAAKIMGDKAKQVTIPLSGHNPWNEQRLIRNKWWSIVDNYLDDRVAHFKRERMMKLMRDNLKPKSNDNAPQKGKDKKPRGKKGPWGFFRAS